jgi:hypothetical protein
MERMNSPYAREDAPGLEGPDYVTLVIEWNEDSDAATLVSATEPSRPSSMRRTIATVVGALAAIAFATWGIRHLRMS